MENENLQHESKAWFSELSWKNLLLSALLGSLFGSGGAGIVGRNRGECLTQDQADVRYLSIVEADKRAAKRDIQADRIEIKIDEMMKKLDEKYVRKELYEQNNKSMESLINQVLVNQKNLKNF